MVADAALVVSLAGVHVSSQQLVEALRGITAVLVTPYAAGTIGIDEEMCAKLAASIDEAGIHVLTALGNTAEVHQLDAAERAAVLRGVVSGRRHAVLIAGLTGPANELLRTGVMAAELGYDALMVHEPVDPFGDGAGFASHYRWLCDRLPLPVVLYLRSTRICEADLAELVSHPSVVGVKYARPDLHTLADLLAGSAGSACVWVNGLAESAVPAFAGLGITGFTSGLANVRPDAALAVHHAAIRGDLRRLQDLMRLISPTENLRTGNANRYNVAVIKEMLRLRGLGTGGVRPPSSDLDDDSRQALRALLEQWPADLSDKTV